MKHPFKTIGTDVSIYDPVTIIRPEVISLANHIIFSEFVYLNGGMSTFIGNHVHISAHCSISGGGYFIMEDFSGMAAGARIITGSAMVNGEGLTNPTLPRAFQNTMRSFVILKKHSLVATNVIVHPGVIIGEGAVIGSGSVVTKDLEPWAIYISSPAKKVKDRESRNILRLEEELYKAQSLTPSDFRKEIAAILAEMRRGK